MGILSASLFSVLVGIAICEEFATGDSDPNPLVPVTIFITTEQYRACKEYGHCTFTPQSVSLNEPGDLHDNLEDKSYFELCRKIHLKMEKLESEHPEVKHLNHMLKQMLDAFSSDFEFESEKGERIALKLLDLAKNLIEKLKLEFDEESYKMHKPEPIPIVESVAEEEITAEPKPGHATFAGSMRGIPGIHFPNYTEIPISSFTCSDKEVIPGFYADLETGCQVFHLCYEHRRESFLCPIGTIFNQPILACDYWYSANCSQAPIYYEKPNIPEPLPPVAEEEDVEEIVEHPKEDVDFLKFLPVKGKVIDIPEFGKPIKTPIGKPVAFKDTEVIADKIFDGILSLGSKVVSKTRDVLQKIPDPQDEVPLKLKSKSFEDKLKAKAHSALPLIKAKKVTSAAKLSAATKLASAAAFTSGKAKIASIAAIPLVKSKIAAAGVLPMMKTKVALGAIPLVKAEAAALKVPIVKTKMALGAIPLVKADAAAIKAVKVKKTAKAVALGSIPLVKARAAALKVPVVKTKMALGAVPVEKTKMALGAIPLVKAQAAALKVPVVKTKMALGAIPLVKADAAAIKALKVKKTAVPYLKMAALKPKFVMAPLKVKSAAALPLMKAKLAAAAVSPLTKKALALGYLKLLKAKKMALMG